MVKPQVFRQRRQDFAEAAGNRSHHMPGGLGLPDQPFRTVGQFHLGADLRQHALRQPRQGGNPGMQAGRKVQLAAHRRRCHLGDLRFHPGVRGQQFDDFLLDQGGIHIHNDELALRSAQLCGHEGGVHPGQRGGGQFAAQAVQGGVRMGAVGLKLQGKGVDGKAGIRREALLQQMGTAAGQHLPHMVHGGGRERQPRADRIKVGRHNHQFSQRSPQPPATRSPRSPRSRRRMRLLPDRAATSGPPSYLCPGATGRRASRG